MTAFDLPTVGAPSTQKPDARTVNDGGTDVMRQVVVIGDPTNPAAVLPVKAEDTASADGDFGIPILGVRRDSDTPSAGSDGDYTNLKMDEAGRLKVSAQPGNQAQVTGNITANGQTVFADVSRASNVMMHCFGTFSTVNVTFEGSLNSTNGTDGNWFAIQAVRSNANTIELVTGNLSAAPAYGWELSVNGLKYVRVRATAFTSGTQSWVIQPAPYATEPIPAAQVSGTQPISGSVTATGITGTVAHDAVGTSNPVRVAGRARNVAPTPVSADGDTCDIVTTMQGAVVQRPYAIPETDWSYSAASGGIVNTTDVVLASSAGSTLRRYLTGISIQNASATIATEVVVKDGSTVIWRGYVGTSALLNSAVGITFPTPLKTTINTALNVACITTGAQVYVNAQGYSAP